MFQALLTRFSSYDSNIEQSLTSLRDPGSFCGAITRNDRCHLRPIPCSNPVVRNYPHQKSHRCSSLTSLTAASSIISPSLPPACPPLVHSSNGSDPTTGSTSPLNPRPYGTTNTGTPKRLSAHGHGRTRQYRTTPYQGIPP